MEVTTLSYENLHNHGELFANMFRARHQTFIVHNKWDLPQANGMEFDQYDTPAGRSASDPDNPPLRHLFLHDPRRARGASCLDSLEPAV